MAVREKAMRLIGTALLLASSTATVWGLSTPTSDHWPRLGGPDGSGVSSATDIPTHWSDTENVLWKTALPGRGHSAPTVWGDRIFLTTAVRLDKTTDRPRPVHYLGGAEWRHPDSLGGEFLHEYRVLGLNASDGSVLWNRVVATAFPFDDRHASNSYASPTVATDGKHVYAWFGSEGLFALDRDGNPVWSADLGPVPLLGLGVGSSPIVHDGLVIVQIDRENGEDSEIVGVDGASGQIVWRTPRPNRRSWSTAVVVETSARTELVTSGYEVIQAYDPATGEELWRIDGLGNQALHRPLVHEDLVIHTSGYPDKKVMAVRLGGSGALAGTDRLAWTYHKGTAYVPSGILYEGLLYLVAGNGVLTCLDAVTGEVVYEGGRSPVPQGYMASPIAWDGKILLPGEDGEMVVVRAGPEFEVLAVNSLGESVWAMPAIADGRLLIRGRRHLWAIGNPR